MRVSQSQKRHHHVGSRHHVGADDWGRTHVGPSAVHHVGPLA